MANVPHSSRRQTGLLPEVTEIQFVARGQRLRQYIQFVAEMKNGGHLFYPLQEKFLGIR